MIWFLILFFGVIPSVWAYGKMVAFFQRKYPALAAADYWNDRIVCLHALVPIAGPLATILFLRRYEDYGILFFGKVKQ